jgi:large subunit ribosomal protein L18
MAKTSNKVLARLKRIKRIRKNISGTTERPRLRVFKSGKHIYAQIIDDTKGHTIASASSINSEVKEADLSGKTAKANKVGLVLAEKAKANGIKDVVFDRGGFVYHGRIKALSEGAREGGLVF